jgi:hypothetical protein
MQVRYTPASFHGVVRAMLASSGFSARELSVRAGFYADVISKILTGKTVYPTLPTQCRLAETAGWTRERLDLEIDKAGLVLKALPRDQGWRSPRIKLQEVML